MINDLSRVHKERENNVESYYSKWLTFAFTISKGKCKHPRPRVLPDFDTTAICDDTYKSWEVGSKSLFALGEKKN